MLLVAGIFLAAMVVDVSMMHDKTEGLLPKEDTHEVFDSPEPTRLPCSPFPPTPTPKRRPARRAGAARIAAHTRLCAKVGGPKQKGHCGYVCVLQACGVRPTHKKIMELREKTACVVGDYIVQDKVLGGREARQLPVEAEQSYYAYLADVRGRQWSSTAELEAACMAMNIQLQVQEGSRLITLNEGDQAKPYRIRMRDAHYTLWRTARTRKVG